MQGPESRPSFIDRAREVLGIEKGRSKWEYVGAGFKLAAAAEAAWGLTDFITGHPFEGTVKVISAIGVRIAGHMLHDRRNDLSKSKGYIDRDGLPIFFTAANLGMTIISLTGDKTLSSIVLIGIFVLGVEMYRRQVNIDIEEAEATKKSPGNP